MPWPPCENGTGTYLPWLHRNSGERKGCGEGEKRWKMEDIPGFARKDGTRGNSSSVGKSRSLLVEIGILVF